MGNTGSGFSNSGNTGGGFNNCGNPGSKFSDRPTGNPGIGFINSGNPANRFLNSGNPAGGGFGGPVNPGGFGAASKPAASLTDLTAGAVLLATIVQGLSTLGAVAANNLQQQRPMGMQQQMAGPGNPNVGGGLMNAMGNNLNQFQMNGGGGGMGAMFNRAGPGGMQNPLQHQQQQNLPPWLNQLQQQTQQQQRAQPPWLQNNNNLSQNYGSRFGGSGFSG